MKAFIAVLFTFASLTSFAQKAKKPMPTAPVVEKPMPATYKIHTDSSKIVWVGKKITGEHTGTIAIKSGNIQAVGEEIVGGEVVVDMDSITCTDITDKEHNDKFLGHIKSPDFFDTAKHHESKLMITGSKKTKKGLEVMGDLTLLGKTNKVSFIVEPMVDAHSYKAKGVITLDRTKWDLKYGSSSFFKGLGDKAIKNEFTLTVDITAKN